MAEETQDILAAPEDAPVTLHAGGEPEGVVEGDGEARGTGDSNERSWEPTAAASLAQPELPPAPAAHPRAGARGFLAGVLGGLIVSALGAGAGYTLLASKADVSKNARQLNDLEAEARQNNSALAADLSRDRAALATLDKRVGALGAGQAGTAELEKRVATLEAATPNAASEAAPPLTVEAKDLRNDIDAVRTAIPALSARVAKLEAETSKTASAGPDRAAFSARIEKIEAALAAQKSKSSPTDNAAAVAIIAGAIGDKLGAGTPFRPELAELKRLGVDPAMLTALGAVADGAPTNDALAASFDAVAPKVLAAASKPERGEVADRFLAHIEGLVRVRDLKESAGSDPPALVSQIEGASRRGDTAGALAAFNKLPEAARQAAGGWPKAARARQAAEAALRSIREAAIERLAGGTKP